MTSLMTVGVGGGVAGAVSALGGLYSSGTGVDVNNLRDSSTYIDATTQSVATVGDTEHRGREAQAAGYLYDIPVDAPAVGASESDINLWGNSAQPAPKAPAVGASDSLYDINLWGNSAQPAPKAPDAMQVLDDFLGPVPDSMVVELPIGSGSSGNDLAEIQGGGSDVAGKESAEFAAAPDRSLSLGSQNGSSTGQAVGASVVVGVGAVAAVAVTAGVGAAASAAAALAALVALIAGILFIIKTLRKLAKYALFLAVFFFALFLCLTFVSLS